jgi:hypothetical protein
MSATNSATLNVSSTGGNAYVSVDQNISQTGPAAYGSATNKVDGTVTAQGGDASVQIKQNIDQKPMWRPFPIFHPPFCHKKPHLYV